MKPCITIELKQYRLDSAYLWKCTLPNGRSRYCGAVRIFTLEEVLNCRRTRRWAERELVKAAQA